MPLTYRKPADVWDAAQVAGKLAAPANAELCVYAFAANTFEALWMSAARERDRLLGVDPDEEEDTEDGPDTGDPVGLDDSPCPRCDGSGVYQRLGYPPGPCAVCDGTGRIFPEPAALDDPIPYALAADVPTVTQ